MRDLFHLSLSAICSNDNTYINMILLWMTLFLSNSQGCAIKEMQQMMYHWCPPKKGKFFNSTEVRFSTFYYALKFLWWATKTALTQSCINEFLTSVVWIYNNFVNNLVIKYRFEKYLKESIWLTFHLEVFSENNFRFRDIIKIVRQIWKLQSWMG